MVASAARPQAVSATRLEPKWLRSVVVVVVVVVVVRTDDLAHEFLLARQWKHLIMGAVSLCTGP